MTIRFLKLSLASPESIRFWTERTLSNGNKVGKILKGDLIDYKNGLPIRDGLNCERIFGPVVSFTCSCGRFKCFETRGIHVVHDYGIMARLDNKTPKTSSVSKSQNYQLEEKKSGIMESNRYPKVLNKFPYDGGALKQKDKIMNNFVFMFSLFCSTEMWSFYGARHIDIIRIYQKLAYDGGALKKKMISNAKTHSRKTTQTNLKSSKTTYSQFVPKSSAERKSGKQKQFLTSSIHEELNGNHSLIKESWKAKFKMCFPLKHNLIFSLPNFETWYSTGRTYSRSSVKKRLLQNHNTTFLNNPLKTLTIKQFYLFYNSFHLFLFYNSKFVFSNISKFNDKTKMSSLLDSRNQENFSFSFDSSKQKEVNELSDLAEDKENISSSKKSQYKETFDKDRIPTQREKNGEKRFENSFLYKRKNVERSFFDHSFLVPSDFLFFGLRTSVRENQGRKKEITHSDQNDLYLRNMSFISYKGLEKFIFFSKSSKKHQKNLYYYNRYHFFKSTYSLHFVNEFENIINKTSFFSWPDLLNNPSLSLKNLKRKGQISDQTLKYHIQLKNRWIDYYITNKQKNFELGKYGNHSLVDFLFRQNKMINIGSNLLFYNNNSKELYNFYSATLKSHNIYEWFMISKNDTYHSSKTYLRHSNKFFLPTAKAYFDKKESYIEPLKTNNGSPFQSSFKQWNTNENYLQNLSNSCTNLDQNPSIDKFLDNQKDAKQSLMLSRLNFKNYMSLNQLFPIYNDLGSIFPFSYFLPEKAFRRFNREQKSQFFKTVLKSHKNKKLLLTDLFFEIQNDNLSSTHFNQKLNKFFKKMDSDQMTSYGWAKQKRRNLLSVFNYDPKKFTKQSFIHFFITLNNYIGPFSQFEFNHKTFPSRSLLPLITFRSSLRNQNIDTYFHLSMKQNGKTKKMNLELNSIAVLILNKNTAKRIQFEQSHDSKNSFLISPFSKTKNNLYFLKKQYPFSSSIHKFESIGIRKLSEATKNRLLYRNHMGNGSFSLF
nr:hypothetical protein [Trentepohlia sp. YN1242]